MFDPELTVSLWLSVEIFNMFSSALSAFLGLFAFSLLPLAYAAYRLRKPPKEEVQEPNQVPPATGEGEEAKLGEAEATEGGGGEAASESLASGTR